jgi:AmiR/NasT family two-component response regulator
MTLVEEPRRRVARYRQAVARVDSAPPPCAQLQQQVEQLTLALETNRVIGAAVGILMERFDLDRAAAFAFLKRMSQSANVTICRLAGNLVDDAESRGARRR